MGKGFLNENKKDFGICFVGTYDNISVADILPDGFPIIEVATKAEYWKNAEDTLCCISKAGSLFFENTVYYNDYIDLQTVLTKDGNSWKCKTGLNNADVTFVMSGDAFSSIIISGETGRSETINGEYITPPPYNSYHLKRITKLVGKPCGFPIFCF